jgi:hypothetical protein
MGENAELVFGNFPLIIVSNFVRISKLSGNNLGAKLERPAAI